MAGGIHPAVHHRLRGGVTISDVFPCCAVSQLQNVMKGIGSIRAYMVKNGYQFTASGGRIRLQCRHTGKGGESFFAPLLIDEFHYLLHKGIDFVQTGKALYLDVIVAAADCLPLPFGRKCGFLDGDPGPQIVAQGIRMCAPQEQV